MIARTMCTAAFLVLSAAAGSAQDAKRDLEKLQGEWKAVSVTFRGEKRDEDTIKKMKPLVIKGNEWTAPGGLKLTLKINPSKSPKELDLQVKEVTYRGIFKLEGDTLTFCRAYFESGERPKDFKAGEDVILFIYKRTGK